MSDPKRLSCKPFGSSELDYGQLDSPIDLLDPKLLITAACPECINNEKLQALELKDSSLISRELKCLPNVSYGKSCNCNNKMYGTYRALAVN